MDIAIDQTGPQAGPQAGPQPELPGSALEELICFDLYAASRAVTATYRPLLAQIGLTYPQYLVLVVLWEQRECTIGHLVQALRLDHGTLTPLLRRMEEAGLLVRTRSAADERRVLVGVTERGQELSRHRHDLTCRIGDSLGLTPEQVETLRDLLRIVTAGPPD